MSFYSREQIQRIARRGPVLSFLKSQSVANAVAKKVELKLKELRVSGVDVEVTPDRRHTGAWKVRVMHMPLRASRHSDLTHAFRENNSRESQAIGQALDVSYTSADLLTYWSSSR